MNRGGNVIIGQPGGCLLQVTSLDTTTDIHLTWNIPSKDETERGTPQELRGDKCTQALGTPFIIENPKGASISITEISKHSRIIFIPIPLERLESGRYQMTIALTQGTLKCHPDFFFNVLWPLKPHSLSDLKIAIDALRHIATEAELDSISALTRVNR